MLVRSEFTICEIPESGSFVFPKTLTPIAVTAAFPLHSSFSSLIIRIGSQHLTLEGFASRRDRFKAIRPKSKEVVAQPAVATFDYIFLTPRTVLLVGALEIVAIDAHEQQVFGVLQLYRNNRTMSYEQLAAFFLDDSMIFLYESGIARLSFDARCQWHTPLFWDDIGISMDEDYYVFENEHSNEGRPQRVDLSTGVIEFLTEKDEWMRPPLTSLSPEDPAER